ncbi:MAG: hypothetical protein EA420_20065, partial [Candidatus Competibacteraceae bacterium]
AFAREARSHQGAVVSGGAVKGERRKAKGENIPMTDHDHGYKRLFSHPEMIRDMEVLRFKF